MSNRAIDLSPVPSDVGTSIDDALPIRSDIIVVELLAQILDRLDGILYHLVVPDVEEDRDTEH